MLRGLFILLRMTGVPRLVGKLMLDRRVPWKLKLLLPAAIAYVISPIDLVPDMLSVLGRLDDVLALLIPLALYTGMAPKEVVTEHLRSGRAGPQARHRNPRSDPTVIDGSYRVIDDPEESER